MSEHLEQKVFGDIDLNSQNQLWNNFQEYFKKQHLRFDCALLKLLSFSKVLTLFPR